MSCLQTYSVTARSVPTQVDSGVFDSIDALIDSVSVNEMTIDPPDIPSPRIGVEVDDAAAAEMENPQVHAATGRPSLSATLPSLSSALYNAVTGLIDFSFESPLVPNIQYRQGQGHLSVPDRTVSEPPTDYPEEDLLALPQEPEIAMIDAPELEIGERPDVRPIQMRDYNVAPLEPMDLDVTALLEQFGDMDLPDVEAMAYPEYDPYGADAELVRKVGQLVEGAEDLQRWIGTEVQGRLNEADTRRQKMQVKQQVDGVFRDAAARNFPLPTGAVDAKVAELSEQDANQRFEKAHEIQQEVYEAAISTLADAVTRSIQIERYHLAEYVSYVRRSVEAYKLNVGLAQAAYNALVDIYNNSRQIVEAQVAGYRQYVQAVTDQNRALGLQTDLTQARVENFQSQVQMFRSDVDVLRASARVQEVDAEQQMIPLEVYESTLQGTLANLEVVRQNITGYRQAIDNYSQATDWYSDAIGAFETAVQAESSNVGVTEENLRAYKQLWAAENSRIGDFKGYVQDSVSTMSAEVSRYESAASQQQQYLRSVGSSLADSLSAVDSWGSLAGQEARTMQAFNSARTSYTAGRDRTTIAAEDLRVVQRSLDESAKAERLRLQAARESVTARAAGALAQAASSVYQVNLSGSGTATEAVDGAVSARSRTSMSERKSWQNQCVSETRALRG